MIFEISFAAAVIFFILVDRLVVCLSILIFGLMRPDLAPLSKSRLHTYAGLQFAGSFTPLLGNILSSVLDAFLSAISVLATVSVFAVIFTVTFTILYLIFEYTPECAINFVLYWNRFVGPALQLLVFAPLRLLGAVIRPVLALYDFTVWVVFRVTAEIFLVGGLEQLVAVQQFASATAAFIQHVSMSVFNFAYSIVVDCDFDSSFVGDLCYEVGPRQLDLVTPMHDVGVIAKSLAVAVGGVCTVASAPLDILVYPLTDVNIARGVHDIANAVLYTIFQLPVVTFKRCGSYRDDGIIMCLPDFEPPFDLLSRGLRSLGLGLDNWVNIASVVTRKAVGLEVPLCDAVGEGLTASSYSRALFGTRQIAVVGLTDFLYGVTDGISVQYFTHSNRFESEILPNAWPIQVDPLHQVASVLYNEYVDERDEIGNQRTSMMGCRCVDDESSGEMRIECAFALYGGGGVSAPPFQAVFAKRSTAKYLTCKQIEISVQSVRWPVSRIVSSDARDLRGSCITKGDCSRVDALVYVQPLCASDESPGLACTPLFTESSCYPWCLAARVSGSGTQDLVLYDADQWKESVLVLDRDCTIASQLATGDLVRQCVQSGDCKTESYDLSSNPGQVMSKLPKSLVEEWVVSRKWDANAGCVFASGGTSVIPRVLLNATSSLRFRSVFGVQQAFSFAGDTVLTPVRSGAGEYSIRVDRLYGDERNEFSMVTVRKGFPAISPDPDQVFSSEQELTENGTPIPPVFNDMSNVRHPSAATRDSVYFVVNPSLAMFKGFASYCMSNGVGGKLQLSALSSYAAIRVFRLKPYGYCSLGDDGSQECSDQVGASSLVPGGYLDSPYGPFDVNNCERKFSVSVSGIEVLDDSNIVLTVLNASLSEFDVYTGRLKENASKASYELVYMHPDTMAMSDVPFTQPIDSITLQGQLCPAWRLFPPVGSLVTEPAVTLVQIFRFPISLITSLPGLVELWRSGRKCPSSTHGHTLLKGCGEELFLLTEFWRSLVRSNQIFWSTLGYVSGGLRRIGGSRVAEIIDGVAYFGEATSIPVDMTGLTGVFKSVVIPTDAVTNGIVSAVFPSVPQVFTVSLVGNPIKVAQFSYNLIATTVTQIIPVAVQGQDLWRRLLLIFMDQLYQGREQFYESVVRSINGGCSGLSLMAGYDNPWGALLRTSCEAAPLTVVGLYDVILAVFIDVPVASCMCVEARNAGNFARYALDTCYPKVPTHMKNLVLMLIEMAKVSGDMDAACNMLVDRAGSNLEGSMTPFFDKAAEATRHVSSSFDYLFTQFMKDSSRCLDFDENGAGAIVLMPFPHDYFNACALTSLCSTLCSAELTAFKKALSLYTMPATQLVKQVRIEAPFFSSAGESSYMPMHIVAMAELTGPVCPSNARALGVAGIGFNGTVCVKKFCLPKARGVSTYEVAQERWWVWFSEEWSSTITDLQFAEVYTGDSLVILRDGSGYSKDQASVKGPGETFLSVHTRMSQRDLNIWSRYYFSAESRLSNQMLAQGSSPVASRPWKGIAITDVLVQPIGMSLAGHAVVAYRQDVYDGSGNLVSKTVCASLYLSTEANLVFLANGDVTLSECKSLGILFETVRVGYKPILYEGGVWLVPTKKDLDLKRIPYTAGLLSDVGDSVVVPSHGMFGQKSMGSTFQSWNRLSRGILSGMKSIVGRNDHVAGQSIASDFGPRMSQNTLSALDGGSLEFLVSGNPGISTHWVSSALVTISDGEVVGLKRSASSPADVSMTVELQCNRESCVGCPTTALLNLCYALRQCAIVNCVGTTVALKRPLCNVGLLAQTRLAKKMELVRSAWQVFAETYKSILNLATNKGDKEFELEWVDDAFFGFVCLAKDQGGELSALFMSFFGALVSKIQKTSYVDLSSGERVTVDTRASARSSMIFAGTTSMLYQLSLAPLYQLIVMHKTAMCTTSNFFANVQETGLLGGISIRLGRRDLSMASDVAAGVCMTSFFENEARERPSSMDGTALSTSLLDTAPSSIEGSQNILGGLGGMATQALTNHIQVLHHTLDAIISYSIGVVSGAQDMAQAIDEYHCRLPDYYMYRNLECGCNDTPVRVKEASRKRKEHSYWCTGSLQLTDSFGKPAYVVNPYTYDELVGLVEKKAKDYLMCLSQHYGRFGVREPCSWVAVPGLDDRPALEGVTSIAVLQKCRANFLLKEWDQGAFYKFRDVKVISDAVDLCITTQAQYGEGPQACLDDYLLRNDMTKDEYFAYETTDLGSVDACIVASGPAKLANYTLAQKFLPCVQSMESCGVDGTVESCQLSPMIWEGSTSNRVPVGYSHWVGEQNLQATAEDMIECAKASVLAKLVQMTSYANTNLDVVLFSAEGDALHQVFDCIALGPYSRVDFWSGGIDGSMPVPFWSRDAQGSGDSRQMEVPCTPTDDRVPPFTCGSVARKRIIKSFVRSYVNERSMGGDLVQRMVREKVQDLVAAWNRSTTDLLCPLTGQGCDRFLPDALNVSFDEISGSHVLRSIFDMIPGYMQEVFTENKAFAHQSPGDEAGTDIWNWEELGFSDIARDSGLFNPAEPIVEYSTSEAGWPFRNGTTLWDMCTGLVSQVMFTMPLRQAGDQWVASTAANLLAQGHEFDYTVLKDFEDDKVPDPSDGATSLERYVSALLMDAFKHSSLFWHYAMRHSPSESTSCDGEDPASVGATFSFNLDAFVQDAGSGLHGIEFPLHGYRAFPIGGSNRSCLCSWPAQGDVCQVPTAVCEAAGLEMCSYALHGDGREEVEATVLSYWANAPDPVVECPETDLSDSWGVIVERHGLFLDNSAPSPSTSRRLLAYETLGVKTVSRQLLAYETLGVKTVSRQDWKSLTNSSAGKFFQVNGTQLVEFSPSGIRLGNLAQIKKIASSSVNPQARVRQLRSAKGTVAIQRCGQKILGSVDTDDFLDDVVDDLFPVGQGIKESRPTSVCLRFSIEYLRKRLLDVMQSNGIPSLGDKILRQESVVAEWRARCTAQLDMLGVCNSNRIFNIVPARVREHSCPFKMSPSENVSKYYVTSGCIVFLAEDDAFYDPCMDAALCSNQALTAGAIKGCPSCPMPLDVRQIGANDTLGVFPVRFLSGNTTHDEEMGVLSSLLKVEREQGKSGLPWRLMPSFADKVLSGGHAVGNVPASKSWWDAEGFSGSNGSALFCDSIQDWWPLNWTMPVGYHVTLPCSNPAHRTFDSAFAVRYGSDGTKYMVFHSMLLRNQTSFANDHGVGGFCRRSNYGMPIHTINTMRVCTRDAKDVKFDPSVPIKPSWPTGEYGDEHCSPTAFDTPWNIEDVAQGTMHPGMFSVGHVPFYFSETTDYPLYVGQLKHVRPGVNDTTWSDECGNDEVFECSSDSDCELIDGVSGVVGSPECFRGVCILREEGACYAHEHCAHLGKMCSGEGVCEFQTWQVHNDLTDDEADFDLFTQNCSSGQAGLVDSYDMWGASHWHDIPDVLELYGLCSYRSWYEYLDFIKNMTYQDEMQGLSALTRMWTDTATDFTLQPKDSLWNQKKFRVRAHACDRDYMHLDRFKGCAPRLDGTDEETSGIFMVKNGLPIRDNSRGDDVRGRYARTFSRSGEDLDADIRVHASRSVAFEQDLSLGFMSQNGSGYAFGYCRDQMQCVRDAYADTYQGVPMKGGRKVLEGGALRNWRWSDKNTCGVYGILTGGVCKLDSAILPLYHVVCENRVRVCGIDFQSACDAIKTQYQNILVQDVAEAVAIKLNDLWRKLAAEAGNAATKTETYTGKMDCAVELYNQFKGLTCDPNKVTTAFCTPYHADALRMNPPRITGGYYVSKHTYREFPFLFWQKCSLMQGRSLDEAANRCGAWESKRPISQLKSVDEITSYDVLLELDAGLTAGDRAEWTSGLVASARGYFSTLDAHPNWEEYLAGWQNPFPVCRAGVVYKDAAACYKPIVNLALDPLRASALPPGCRDFVLKNAADSVQGLLKEHAIKLALAGSQGGQVNQGDFLQALRPGKLWSSLSAANFVWNEYDFEGVDLQDTLQRWPLSERADLAPRLVLQRVRQAANDSTYLQCSEDVLRGQYAGEAHCTAVYNFVDSAIDALTGGGAEWDQAGDTLAFKWVGAYGTDRMRSANTQIFEQCRSRMRKDAEANTRSKCKNPGMLTSDFCFNPGNIKLHFAKKQAQDDANAARKQLLNVSFASFCTIPCQGCEWACINVPTIYDRSWEHKDKLADAWAGKRLIRTRDDFLTRVLKHIVKWEGSYQTSKHDEDFLRRVFYSNHDYKKAWRFMATAYKGTSVNDKRIITQYCDKEPNLWEGYKTPELLTDRKCLNAGKLRAIADNDQEFQEAMAEAFVKSFIVELYQFTGDTEDVLGCYEGSILYASKVYASDNAFKLRDAEGSCQWNCSSPALKQYFTSCINPTTPAILRMGYSKLLASSANRFASVFRATPPRPRALGFHDGSAEWSFTKGLDLVTLRSFDDNVELLKEMYSCAENIPELVYGTCNESQAYIQAGQNYRSHVMASGGVRIPPGEILFFSGLSHGHGISATLPAWSNHSRESRKMFGKWVMDPSETCPLSNSWNSVCIIKNGERYPSSPWVAGSFNAFELCDTAMSSPLSTSTIVQEIVDADCHPEACPHQNSYQHPFWANMPFLQQAGLGTCQGRNGRLVTRSNVPRTVDQYNEVGDLIKTSSKFPSYNNNLCGAAPVTPSECKHAQGMLGGRMGSKMHGRKAREDALYDTVLFSVPEEQRGRALFLQGGNPLYKGGKVRLASSEGEMSFLQSSAGELGGTHVVLKIAKVEDEDPIMFIDKAPLACSGCTTPESRIKNSLFSNQTHGLFGWLENLGASIRGDEALIDELYPAVKGSSTWSCPLRRIAFYSKVIDDPNFSPLVPNPLRAARLFNWDSNSMNFNSRSHPTQRHETLRRLPDIFTVNGFCMCPYVGSGALSLSGCRFSKTDENCGYDATLKSTYDGQWRNWTVKRIPLTYAPCPDQLDWPYENGTMRDSTVKRVGAKDTCDVTDRLPKFQFRYINSGMVQKHKKTSLDQGGACHMGIPGAWPGSGNTYMSTSAQLCTKVNETDDNITVSCIAGDTSTTYTLAKQRIAAPEWAAQAMREQRVRCDQCSPLPQWQYVHNKGQGQTEVKALQHPEVSYGIPFRWSSARLLAASAKSAICGSRSNTSLACMALLNQTSWQGNNFMRLFTREGVEQLLADPTTQRSPGLKDRLEEDWLYSEDDLWNASGWVACTQEKKSKCFGTIPKAVWLSSNRHKACLDEYTHWLKKGSVQDNAVGIDVCTLDAGLNELCRVIQEAKQKVVDANCLLSKNCTRGMHVYTPGFYSVSNLEFSRATVINYYRSYAGSAEVCPLESETEELQARNAELHMHCASTGLESLKSGLRVVRKVVHVVVQATYIYYQLVVSICKLLVSTITQDTAVVIKEIEFWFQHFINMLFDAVEEIGNLIYRMVMNTGGFGQVLQEIVEIICKILEFLTANVWNTFVCPVLRDVVTPILRVLVDIIRGVLTVIPIDTGTLFNDLDTVINFMAALECNDQISCAEMEFVQAETPSASLPVATRCFVDYVPALDDTSPYSCTRSDTCTNPTFTYGGDDGDNLQLCDLCDPTTDPDALNRYGCDIYQQTCSCGTPRTERTYCTKNDECYLPDTQCSLVSDYTTGTSYGSMPCGAWSDGEPVCLRLDGNVGTCSRLLQSSVQLQACEAPGETAFPSGGSLCGLGSREFETHVSYMAAWGDLAVLPCAMISSGAAFCVKTLSKGNIIVGASSGVVGVTGRRLLSTGPLPDNDVQNPFIQPLDHLEWDHVSDPCRLLAIARMSNKTLSITEDHTLTWCYRRRDLANYTISQLNLTRFVHGDHFLLSLTDFIDVASRRGALYQLLFESKWLEFTMSHSKAVRKIKRIVESLILSAALSLQSTHDPWIANVTNSVGLQVYRDAQVAALRAMVTVASESRSDNPDNDTRLEDESAALENESAANDVGGLDNHTWPSRRLMSTSDVDVRLASLERLLETLRQLPNSFYRDLGLARKNLSGSGDSCSAGANIIEIVSEAALVLTRFFNPFTPDPALGDWQWKLPSFNATGASGNKTATGNLLYDATINYILDPYLGLNAHSVANFFSPSDDMPGDAFTFENSIKAMFKCDFEEVIMCKNPRRRLLTAIIMSVVMYWIASYILQASALPIPLWIIIPSLALYLAYGTAPTCTPMLSTCLWPDLIDTLNMVAPYNFYWPQAIQEYPGCLPTKDMPSPSVPPPGKESVKVNTPACLKTCRSLGFDGPLANIAWVACSLSQDSCETWDLPIIGGLLTYTGKFAPVVKGLEGDDKRDAFSYCFYTTIASSAPYFFLLVVIIVFVLSFARVPFQILASALHTIVQAICYTHIQEGERSMT